MRRRRPEKREILPDPLYNTNFYRSSDLLMSISKQTYGINKRLLKKYNYENHQVTYVPHGITKNYFKNLKMYQSHS